MLSDENEFISEWLMKLTRCHRNWGFKLCFLYLRNVKGFHWNHKRVYRIYRELELNLRIKPKKRLYRDKPELFSVPTSINQTWSMDFMHDQLSDGRSFRAFNVIDDFNREGLGPKGKRRYTLYSCRHQCSANMKLVYDKDTIAEVMGHGSIETATTHYGRRTTGRKKISKHINRDIVDMLPSPIQSGDVPSPSYTPNSPGSPNSM